MATWAELPRSPEHAFYDRLQDLLQEAGFDAFVEGVCKPYYAGRTASSMINRTSAMRKSGAKHARIRLGAGTNECGHAPVRTAQA
jgi:hypothetical protein